MGVQEKDSAAESLGGWRRRHVRERRVAFVRVAEFTPHTGVLAFGFLIATRPFYKLTFHCLELLRRGINVGA